MFQKSRTSTQAPPTRNSPIHYTSCTVNYIAVLISIGCLTSHKLNIEKRIIKKIIGIWLLMAAFRVGKSCAACLCEKKMARTCPMMMSPTCRYQMVPNVNIGFNCILTVPSKFQPYPKGSDIKTANF